VDELAGVRADDVQAEDLARSLVDDELDEPVRLLGDARASSVSPTAPTSGSMKTARGAAR